MTLWGEETDYFPGPRRIRRSRGACKDGMCGALDCTTCYGPFADRVVDENGEEENENNHHCDAEEDLNA